MSNPSGSSNYEVDQEGRPITTLYLRPLLVGELKQDDILSHFSAFGAVKSVRILNQPKYSYGFVKFIRPESAAKALGLDVHVVAGRTVEIKVASDRHQDFSFLLDLNDDCILEILSMKCLSACDLCSAAESCRRLKEIASRAFKREHKKCEIYSFADYSNAETGQRILRNFGSKIYHLKIDWHQDRHQKQVLDNVLDSVAEHCSSTLQSLDLFYCKPSETFMAKLKPLFKNLKTLYMGKCTLKAASKEMFADCGSLVELHIKDCGDEAPVLLQNKFPKLEQFSLDCGADLDLLESFISRHKNLKSLKIVPFIASSVLQLIAQCKQLETLDCCIRENTTLDLFNLGNLRKLEIRCEVPNVMTMVALGLENLKLLAHLTLHSTEIDSEFVRTLPQLRTLRVLKLWCCTGIQNLNQVGDLGQLTALDIQSREHVVLDIVLLVKRLSKLTCLCVEVPGFELELSTYLRIVDVVRRRGDNCKLKFRLTRYNINYDHLLVHFARNAHLVKMTFSRFEFF